MKENKIYRSIKYRIFPTDEQKIILNCWFGSVRWSWNYLYNKVFNSNYINETEYATTTYTLRNQIRKNGPDWIKEGSELINGSIVENVAEDFAVAYRSYSKNVRKLFKENKLEDSDKYKPKLKTKKDKRFSCTLNRKNDLSFKIENGKINITTTRFLKRQTFYTKKNISIDPLAIKQVCFSYQNGKYYMSLVYENQVLNKPYKIGSRIAIDLGIKTAAVCFDGNSFKEELLPEKIDKLFVKHKKVCSKYSKAKNNSKNKNKLLKRFNKSYKRVIYSRNEWQNKLVDNLIKGYETIIIDKMPFTLRKTLKNVNRKKMSIAPYRFLERLILKAEIYGNKIFSIKQGTPTTQTCSNCGNVLQGKDKLGLDDRVYKCKECGFEKDRDKNSALLIYKYGEKYSILENK